MMKKLMPLLIALSTFSFNVNAAPQLIEQVVYQANFGWGGEGFYITLPVATTGTGCSTQDVIVIPSTLSGYNSSVGTVLAAMTSGVKISTWIDGCFNNRPQVIGMGLNTNN